MYWSASGLQGLTYLKLLYHQTQSKDAGMWSSGLVHWLVRDFVRMVVGSDPSHGKDRDSHFVRPLARVLKSRQPESVPTMPTSLWWNHLSDHPLVQWGITRGVSHEISLP